MIDISKCNRLLDEGFSLITVGENKVPNFPWKQQQTIPLDKNLFKKNYEYRGGIIKKDGTEIPKTDNVGIVTGFNYLECIDVDLKVFSTAKEQKEFWDEYLSYLEDNILDFYDKFVIYKTKNAGYHILYKSKRCNGNKKIAVLKGHNEAVIESRGVGGYIFIYENNNIGDKTYKDIDFISDADRELLWEISNTYNYVEQKNVEIKTTINYPDSTNLKCWDDYNQRTSILDLISRDFEIVRNLKDKYIIRRFNASSPHSGYVYKDSNCMYLFTTGTSFENEKLYSPFMVYAHYNHNGDFSEAAKDLYNQGYGERIKPKPVIEDEIIEIDNNDLIFPLDVFPKELQKYIKVCNQTLNNSIDYMGCALLFTSSIIIGNAIVLEVKRGWRETANLWLALVGKAGVGKTPSINSITFPLDKVNNREIKSYIKNYDKYDAFKQLDPFQKNLVEETKKPKKTQFLVNDITLEALVELHDENKNGVGVNKDELAGWFKDMNKYRQGSDLEHWLSSWSNKQINMNRKTARSAFVQRAFIPVLGGIQPAIMDSFYTEENKDSGFIDRMLFSYPELTPNKYSESEMKKEYLEWYDDYIVSFYEKVKTLIKYTDDNEIEPYVARFTDEAKKEWIRIHDEIVDMQISDDENEYMKSMLPKQLSYIPRFALILNTLYSIENANYDIRIIEKESVLNAEKLSKYFILMAKKIKSQSEARGKIKFEVNKVLGKSNYDKFVSIYKTDKKANKSSLAEILGVSRNMIYKYIKEYETSNH